MNILIKFPSRGRPDKFRQALDQYLNLQSKKHNLSFICSFDIDDTYMNNEAMKEYLNQYLNIQYFYGNSSNKIEAINANMDAADTFDILILAADDLFPIIDNYDDIIITDMMKAYPDMDGMLHYMNPSWGDRLDIGCIMTYYYYKRFIFIYHPSYKSIFCDNEYTETAKLLKKYTYIPKQIFAHNYIVSDPTADRNWRFNKEDEDNFSIRKQNNFDIKYV